MSTGARPKTFHKLLAANRSEIAIRIFRAATELDLRTVAIYAQEDRLAVHRFKADESCEGRLPRRHGVGHLRVMHCIVLAIRLLRDA